MSRLAGLIGSQPSPRVLAQTHDTRRGPRHRVPARPGHAGPRHHHRLRAGRRRHDGIRRRGDRRSLVRLGSRRRSSSIAGAYAQGLRDAGVLPVLKHFPGHGHASGDSHEGGVVTPPLADLQTNDLIPYRDADHAGAGRRHGRPHAGARADRQRPRQPQPRRLRRCCARAATAARGFGGLVFTDDLSSMGAINQRYGVADAVLRALQAGADVALWVTTDEVPAVLDRLEKALAAGELSQGRVDDSVLKVAAVRRARIRSADGAELQAVHAGGVVHADHVDDRDRVLLGAVAGAYPPAEDQAHGPAPQHRAEQMELRRPEAHPRSTAAWRRVRCRAPRRPARSSALPR